MKSPTARQVAAVLCLLASPALAASAEDVFFAGNEHAVWLARRASDGKGLDVLARPAGQKWKWIERGYQGRPTAVVAVGTHLHVLFQPGAHTSFHLGGQDPSPNRTCEDPNWPPGAAPLAVCEGKNFGGGDSSSILAIVPRAAGAAARARPATQPATAATTAPVPKAPAAGRRKQKLLTPAVFRFAEGEWAYLSSPPGVRVQAGARVFAAAVNGALYVLFPHPDSGWNKLIVLSGGKWQDVDLDAKVARSQVLGMLPLDGRLAVVLTRPLAGRPEASAVIAIYDADEGEFALQSVTKDQQPLTWTHSALPRAARFAGHLALLWLDKGKTRFATCDRTGKILSVEEVAVKAPPEGTGVKALEVFLWIVLGATFLPMILLRPKDPPKPFSLPPTMRPASPGKRLLAAVIDLFLSSTVGGAIFMPRDMSRGRMVGLLRDVFKGSQDLPDNLAYAALASLAIFLAYGLVMELRYGATLGKMLLKMRVVGEGGRRAGLREVSLRNLWKIIEMFLPPRLPLLPLVVLFNRNRQRVGDWLARTTVVDARPAPPPPETPAPPPPETPAPPHEQQEPGDEEG